MRLAFALVLAAVVTGFVFASDQSFCAEWCQVPAVMLAFPGSLALMIAPGLPQFAGLAATFLAWALVFWLIFKGGSHRHHARDRIPHRMRRGRHRHHVRDRIRHR